jgi:hypothetical protein
MCKRENREQRTENREQRTENREQRTENREQRENTVFLLFEHRQCYIVVILVQSVTIKFDYFSSDKKFKWLVIVMYSSNSLSSINLNVPPKLPLSIGNESSDG